MADGLQWPVKAFESELIVHRSRLDIHTDASVLTTSVGEGITWTKTATGVYKGTLLAKYTGCAPTSGLGMTVDVTLVRSATNAAVKAVEVISQTVSNGYIEIRTLDAAGAAVDNTTTAVSVNVTIKHHNTTNRL